METLNVERYSIVELGHEEAQEVRGGFLPIAIAVAIVLSLIQNFGDIREGLKDGWHGTPRY